MFEVSKEKLPIPGIRSGLSIYPFGQMKVGDHFDAPRDMGAKKGGTDVRQTSISASARSWTKRHNPDAKFTTRLTENDKGEQIVRCWRVA